MKRFSRKVKTIPVSVIHDDINKKLESPFISQDVKRVYCHMLEDILHATGNYKGYNHIAWRVTGYEKWVKDGRPQDTTQYQGLEYDRYYH